MELAKSEFVELEGKVEWCRPWQPNKWGNWETRLYPTKESLELFRSLKKPLPDGTQGIKNVIQMNEAGDEYIILKRPQSRKYNGVEKGFAPPLVVDKDGLPLRDVSIGNGSDAICRIVVYRHKTGFGGEGYARAIRWEAIKVTNLIEFKRDDFTSDEEKQLPKSEPSW